MRSVESHSRSGREKEGKDGSGFLRVGATDRKSISYLLGDRVCGFFGMSRDFFFYGNSGFHMSTIYLYNTYFKKLTYSVVV